jgi:hypothetical protein
MEKEGAFFVKTREIKRLKVLEQVIEKKIKQKQAGALLKLSVRQIRRLVTEVKKHGIKGLIHKLRGEGSNRRHEEKHKEKIMELYRKKYEGFGPTLAQEKLEELDKLCVNRETLRQWLLKEGLWEVSKKGQKHREWRERKAYFGEMTQIDGSHHDWLEGRGPWLVLMGYIDDATSEVFARFYNYEGTMPAMESFYRYSRKYGMPHSIYLDRLKAYCGQAEPSLEEQLRGKEKADSQFERALEELGVEVIHAQSAQAKGRVERLFRTFQDRMVKEMRLVGIKTREEADEFLENYLPKYNRRFGVKAREEANLHRPAPRDKEFKQILSIQKKHPLRNDNTIRHENQWYQILTEWKGSKPEHLVVQERMDGRLYLMDGSRELKWRKISEPPKREPEIKKKSLMAPRPPKPSMDNPFKAKSFQMYLKRQAARDAKRQLQTTGC